MRVLSLYDGMACGMLAMQNANIPVSRYVAYEIDKYAIKTSTHNFPFIEHRGDVFSADFTEFEGFDFVIGGSPCTFWSIAQKNNRETEASGMGWELFSQYVRAIKEAKPKYFVYENNKSMSKAIRESITQTFGFEPICINSALVSAQSRQRLYWVGVRNEDGTYSKASVEQPEDLGILLKDVLDGAVESINTTDDDTKARTLMAGYYKYGTATLITNEGFKGGTTAVAEPVNVTADGKSQTIKAQYQQSSPANFFGYTSTYGATGVAEPVRVGSLPRPNGELSESQAFRVYGTDGKSVVLSANGGGSGGKTGLYAVPVDSVRVGALPHSNGEPSKSQSAQIYDIEGKSTTLCANGGGLGAKTGLYALPCGSAYATPSKYDENGRPIKAISGADGKEYVVYEVKDGLITIKEKQYPIKLKDGCYIIRKLTINECKRLQTVPEWYEFPVSDSQAYKMLGNGWTVDVIAHILKSIPIK